MNLDNEMIRPVSVTFYDRFLGKLFATLIAFVAKLHSPKAALKFLLRLDTELYKYQSQSAIDYGNGIHPKHRLMNYHDFFVNRISAADRILDIGCGNGAVAYDLAQVCKKVVGIDISEKNIQSALAHYQHPNLEFRVGDALKDFAQDACDVIVLSNVLEHLPERPTFLRRLQKALSPRIVLIRVPVFERDWRIPLKKELGLEWRLDDTHEIEFTLETFASEMHEAGLLIRHLEVRWGEIWAEVVSAE